MLDKWLNAAIRYPECHPIVLSFLNIPNEVIKASTKAYGCRLTQSEIAVAELLKGLSETDLNVTRHLRKFDDLFFSNTEQNISQITTGILLKTLIPLCGNPSSACAAIVILYKLLQIESYRYCDSIKHALFNNIELLREIKIENHILNRYQSHTGLQGFFIANTIKEHFDRNGMAQYFKYFLNFNEEAFELFGIREEGRAYRNTISAQVLLGEWRWLNTENLPGGLKIAFRKTIEHFEVKAEIFIESSVSRISNFVKITEMRILWDAYMKEMKLIKKIGNQRGLIWAVLRKGKKSFVDLALECHIVESEEHSVILFNSIVTDEIPCIVEYPRVKCIESFYEIQNIGNKIRRSSSTTDEVDSEEESISSYKSNHVGFSSDEKKVSKFNMFFKMNPDMARCFVTDLSEETSILKDSLVRLKRIAENSQTFSGLC